MNPEYKPVPGPIQTPLELLRLPNIRLPETGGVGLISGGGCDGASQLAIHLAMDGLARGLHVLHASVITPVEQVRARYDLVYRATHPELDAVTRAELLVRAERNRTIHTWRERTFTVGSLERSLDILHEVADVRPSVIIVDACGCELTEDVISGLIPLAVARRAIIWLTDDRATGELSEPGLFLAIRLEDKGQSASIQFRKPDEEWAELPHAFDPQTLVAMESGERTAAARQEPQACTLYSGGANGTESVFGELAQKYGLTEVNFTFDGHKQARGVGRVVLGPTELAAGDVSLQYVSRRLSRTYSEGSLIRRVLQMIWHMVSRSREVFVVGQIQEDGTVVGGTGWSVELARMWSKRLWVFDQPQGRWFLWDGEEWVPGTPVIETQHFAGTGTRYIEPHGREAIERLFERSFRPQ